MEAASKIMEFENPQKTRNFIVERLDDGRILIEFIGNWTYKANVPVVEKLTDVLSNSDVKKVIFNSEKITVWDSIFVTSVRKLFSFFDKNNIEYDPDSLHEGNSEAH